MDEDIKRFSELILVNSFGRRAVFYYTGLKKVYILGKVPLIVKTIWVVWF